MPQATEDKVVRVEKWAGLNLRDAKNAVGDKELTDCVNYDLGQHGELVKRSGFKTIHDDAVQGGADLGANPVQVLGFYRTDTYQQFIARAGTNLYYSTDAVTWTLIGGGPWGNVEHGVQYVDKFYMVRRDNTIVQWDGVTATAIAGSPMGSHCRVFKDRLFVLNSYGVGVLASRLYYSKIADFSTTGWPATNYIDIGSGDGDWLVACFNVQDFFMVFKTGATWILYVQGDPTLWILRPFNSEIGCVSKHSLVVYEGLLYFASVRGVFQTDGNTVHVISTPISTIFDNIVVSTVSINKASAFIWQDKYVLLVETFPVVPTWNQWSLGTWNALMGTQWAAYGAVYTYCVYHIRQKGWTKWQPAVLAPHIFVAVLLSSALKGVYSGERTNSGKVIKYGDAVYQDDTTSYEAVAETKEYDFGMPTELKRGKWIGVAQRGAGTHSFTHVVDGNAKTPIVLTPDLTLLDLKIKGPEYFRIWRIRCSATHANPLTIFGFAMHLASRRHMAASRG